MPKIAYLLWQDSKEINVLALAEFVKFPEDCLIFLFLSGLGAQTLLKAGIAGHLTSLDVIMMKLFHAQGRHGQYTKSDRFLKLIPNCVGAKSASKIVSLFLCICWELENIVFSTIFRATPMLTTHLEMSIF